MNSLLNKRRVVVTGLGLISPIGIGVAENWANLNGEKSGFVTLPSEEYKRLPCRIAGKIEQTEFIEKLLSMNIIKKSDMKTMSLANMYSLYAAEEAIKDSKWTATNKNDSFRSGTSIATGMSGIMEVAEAALALNEPEKKGYKYISPYFVPKILPNLSSGILSIKYNLRGPNHCVTTACAAGTHAILESYAFIKNDMADMMLVGATEACIHPISIAGFSRMRALASKFNESPHLASRPFDKDRNGFVMSEGAACLVIESLDCAVKRNAKIYGEILGGSLNADASHITNPNGEGAERCMEMAIQNSEINKEDIDYINAHATSTPIGDLAEINAIKRVFMNCQKEVYISSFKGSIGHMLGAAGACETLLTLLACKEKIIPPTKNLNEIDPAIVLNSYLRLNRDEIKIKQRKMIALKNSFGFGGTNASIVVSSYSSD